jgi:hypothetical protein
MTKSIRLAPALGLLAMAGMGCNGGGNDNDGPYANLTGEWEYLTAMENVKCTGKNAMGMAVSSDDNSTVKGSVISLKSGLDAPVIMFDGAPCPVRFDVTGGVLKSRPAQTCETTEEDVQNPTSGLITYTTTIDMVQITVNGTSAMEMTMIRQSGRAAKSPATYDCTITRNGTLKKVAP